MGRPDPKEFASVSDHELASMFIHRWLSLIFKRRKWVLMYSIVLLYVMYMLGSFIFYLVTDRSLSDFGGQLTSTVLYFFPYLAALNLAVIPGLILLGDFKPNRFDLLKSTDIPTRPILLGIFRFSFLYGGLPIMILKLADLLINVYCANSSSQYPVTLIQMLLILLSLLLASTFIASLAILFGLLIRLPIGVFIGPVLPFFLNILSLIMTRQYLNAAHITGYFVSITRPEFFIAMWLRIGFGDVTPLIRNKLFAGSLCKPALISVLVAWVLIALVVHKMRSNRLSYRA